MLGDLNSFTQLLEASSITPIFMRNEEPEKYRYRLKTGCFNCDHAASMSPNNLYNTVSILNENTGYFVAGFVYSPFDIGWQNRSDEDGSFERNIDLLNDRRFYSFRNVWEDGHIFLRAYTTALKDPLTHVSARVRCHTLFRNTRYLYVAKISATHRGVYWGLQALRYNGAWKLAPKDANRLIYAYSQEAGQAELDTIPSSVGAGEMARLQVGESSTPKKKRTDRLINAGEGRNIDENVMDLLRFMARGDRPVVTPATWDYILHTFGEDLFRVSGIPGSRNYRISARVSDEIGALVDAIDNNAVVAPQFRPFNGIRAILEDAEPDVRDVEDDEDWEEDGDE